MLLIGNRSYSCSRSNKKIPAHLSLRISI